MDLVKHDLALEQFYRLWSEVSRRVGRVPEGIPPDDKIMLHRHGVPQQLSVKEFGDVLLDYFFSAIPIRSQYLTALVNLLMPRILAQLASQITTDIDDVYTTVEDGILTESGDFIEAEDGDFIIQEN